MHRRKAETQVIEDAQRREETKNVIVFLAAPLAKLNLAYIFMAPYKRLKLM